MEIMNTIAMVVGYSVIIGAVIALIACVGLYIYGVQALFGKGRD